MYITALYADERGVGALISFNNENYYTSITSSEHENEIYTSSDQKTDIIESKEEESTTKEISSGVNEVIIGKDNSIFLKYTAHLKVKREEQGFKQSVPHITLVTNIKRYDNLFTMFYYGRCLVLLIDSALFSLSSLSLLNVVVIRITVTIIIIDSIMASIIVIITYCRYI